MRDVLVFLGCLALAFGIFQVLKWLADWVAGWVEKGC